MSGSVILRSTVTAKKIVFFIQASYHKFLALSLLVHSTLAACKCQLNELAGYGERYRCCLGQNFLNDMLTVGLTAQLAQQIQC